MFLLLTKAESFSHGVQPKELVNKGGFHEFFWRGARYKKWKTVASTEASTEMKGHMKVIRCWRVQHAESVLSLN